MRRDAIFLRGAVVSSTLLYVAVFNWTYFKVIAPTYGYWGLTANPTPWPYLLVSWVACIVPSLWMRIKILRPSQVFFLIQYYVIFIPACFVLYNSSRPYVPPENALLVVFLMFCGLSIIQAMYYIPLSICCHVRTPSFSFWAAVIAIAAALIGYTVYSFGANFRFADLEEIYSVRSTLAEAVEASGTRFGFYAQMWLAGFFFPFLAAVGLETKRRWLLVLAGGGYLLLFGIGGSKTTLFAFVYFPAVFLWLACANRYKIPVFALGLCFLLSFGVFMDLIGFTGFAYWYVAVVNFRTFSVPAQIIGQFFDFFSNNPLTYMSHVTGIGILIPNPYDMDIPRVIGMHYYNAPVGLNAGFWAGDGLAGFGPPGIIIMSVVCAVLFWIFDSIAKRFETRFVIIAATFIATSFGNISLSTTLVSGGLGLLLISLFVLPNRGTLRTAFRI